MWGPWLGCFTAGGPDAGGLAHCGEADSKGWPCRAQGEKGVFLESSGDPALPSTPPRTANPPRARLPFPLVLHWESSPHASRGCAPLHSTSDHGAERARDHGQCMGEGRRRDAQPVSYTHVKLLACRSYQSLSDKPGAWHSCSFQRAASHFLIGTGERRWVSHPPASRGPALCCVDFRTPQVLCSMLPGPLVLGAFDSFFSFLVSILLLVLWFRMECPSARGPLLSTQLFLLFFIFESCPTTNFPFLSVASW